MPKVYEISVVFHRWIKGLDYYLLLDRERFSGTFESGWMDSAVVVEVARGWTCGWG